MRVVRMLRARRIVVSIMLTWVFAWKKTATAVRQVVLTSCVAFSRRAGLVAKLVSIKRSLIGLSLVMHTFTFVVAIHLV